MKKLMFVFSISSLLLLIHCEDKDPRLDEFERAPYVVFEKKPPKVLGVKAIKDLVYEVTITANRVKTYKLDLKAELSGEPTDTVTLGTFDTFPLHLKYTAEDFANALKKKVEDISFGDHFDFIGTATGDNGTVYYPETPSYKRIVMLKGYDTEKPVIPKGAMVTQTSKGDSTIIRILQKKGMVHEDAYNPGYNYNQAYSFGFTVACPANSYSKDGVAGTYILNDDQEDQYEFVAGPKENEFTIKSFDKDNDLVVTIDLETHELTIAEQAAGTHSKYGTMYIYGEGMAFPCLGKYNMTLSNKVRAGHLYKNEVFNFKKKE